MGILSADPAVVLEHGIGAPPEPAEPPFAGPSQSARLEFHATLQLLAERARFLTAAEGVAVAVGEGRDFVYAAATGVSVPAIHDVANAAAGMIGEAITNGRPISGGDGRVWGMIVPVLREQKISGYFELVSLRAAFGQQEVECVKRLADLAGVAVDLRDSAEHAAARIGTHPAKKSSRPHAWHAPEAANPGNHTDSTAKALSADVMPEKCWWCGFPISQGRKLCVDCEEKNFASISQVEKPMFESEPQESWMERHGYTIATVLVSALAAALIYVLK